MAGLPLATGDHPDHHRCLFSIRTVAPRRGHPGSGGGRPDPAASNFRRAPGKLTVDASTSPTSDRLRKLRKTARPTGSGQDRPDLGLRRFRRPATSPASLLGIPTPVAYKLRRGRRPASARGMNFAVGGSGVLDTGNFQRNVSAQIDLLEAQTGRGGAFSGCDLRSGVALVVVSGNDYSAVAERDNSTSAALGYVPKVVRQMGSDLRRLRDEVGMGKVMVTNLHPIGCAPLFSRALGYSSCDALANMGSVLHNAALQSLLHALDPANRTFLLLDLNAPFARFVSPPPPPQDGGEGKRFRSPRRPCCESFSSDGYCGEEDENGKRQYALCDDLDGYFYWDDVHPTQAAWAAVSALLAPKIRDFLSM